MKKNIKFEEAMQSLEDTAKRLESGSLSLDESLKAFEEAIALIKLCNEKLESAEKKVKILTEGQDGTVTDAPFEVDNEA
jgi:exodeoxyribonuclease VII small subunit